MYAQNQNVEKDTACIYTESSASKHHFLTHWQTLETCQSAEMRELLSCCTSDVYVGTATGISEPP